MRSLAYYNLFIPYERKTGWGSVPPQGTYGGVGLSCVEVEGGRGEDEKEEKIISTIKKTKD